MTSPIALPTGAVVQIAAPAIPLLSMGAPASSIVLVMPTQGIPGPPGASGAAATLNATTAETISGHMVVTVNDSGLMIYADPTNIEHASKPLAMTTGAWAQGVMASATLAGVISDVSWNWTPGAPIYLGDGGLPTQTLPTDAAFSVIVATVISPTTISYQEQTPIGL